MRDSRIVQSGIPINFTTENGRFKTDISRSVNQMYPGSVTINPIYHDANEDRVLLLERVEDKTNGNKCFWFMWYTCSGKPVINISGVIGEADIAEVIRNIASIKF